MLQMKTCSITDGALIARLKLLPLFSGLEGGELASVLAGAHASLRIADAGEMVVSECDRAERLIVVVSGEASVRMVGLTEDRRHLVQRLTRGGVFGITLIGVERESYSAMLTAQTPCELLMLSLAAIRLWIKTALHHRFLGNLLRMASSDGYAAWHQLKLLSCYEISDRILLYLRWRKEEGAEFPLPFHAAELAETLGVNRTALYRALAKLRKSGLIALSESSISLSQMRQQ